MSELNYKAGKEPADNSFRTENEKLVLEAFRAFNIIFSDKFTANTAKKKSYYYSVVAFFFCALLNVLKKQQYCEKCHYNSLMKTIMKYFKIF